MGSTGIHDRARFDHIRYASLWEDADTLCEALEPLGKNKSFLSIASAGDNALALLTLDPKAVVAVDLNETQLACLALRIEAIRHLNYEELLAFLGVTPCETRIDIYESLRSGLDDLYQKFFDERIEAIENGIIHAGKFERFLRAFGCKIVPLIHGRRRITKLLQEKSEYERRSFYEQEWNTAWWRSLFKVFASRPVRGRFGRDPAFVKHVIGSPGERLLERTKYAMTTLSTHNNPYLIYVFEGNFRPDCLPKYLRKETIKIIKNRLDRIKIFRGYAHEAPGGPFDGFNLSDIFEYMNNHEFEAAYKSILANANTGARLVYWNMLVPRKRPDILKSKVERKDLESDSLFRKDKAWFYQAFHIDEVH